MPRTAVLLTILLATPAVAQKNPPSQEPISCQVEEECLTRLRGKVSRKDEVLTIRLGNGKTRKFRPSKACEVDDHPECVGYSLMGYRPAQSVYLVITYGWEANSILLIDANTGGQLELPDEPYFSPSGRWFVVFGGEYEHHLSIWSLDAGRAKRELFYKYYSNGASETWCFLGWDGESRIRFKVSPAETWEKYVETDAVLKEQGWVLNWPFPQ